VLASAVMVQLLRGAGDVARGWRFLLAHPRLLIWVVAPAVVTLLLIIAVIWAGVVLADPAMVWVAAHLPDWLSGWVSGLLRLVVIGCLALIGYLVFVTMAGVLAGPFCEMLSEAVEERVTGREAPGSTVRAFARGLVMGLVHAMRRLLVSVFTVVLVFVLGAAIPVIGPILAIAVGGYFAATAAAYDCFDAVFSRRLWSYRQKIDWLRAHRGRTLGVGGATAGLLLVPIINLFALGSGATGATLAVIDLEAAAPARAVRAS
jgi:CysZ protein